MTTHPRPQRAKRPSIHTKSTVNHYFAGQQPFTTATRARDKKINKDGISYNKVDISVDDNARDYIMSLGYLQAPVVIAGTQQWSGFRPNRLRELADLATAG